jgi:hypothetical protein
MLDKKRAGGFIAAKLMLEKGMWKRGTIFSSFGWVGFAPHIRCFRVGSLACGRDRAWACGGLRRAPKLLRGER